LEGPAGVAISDLTPTRDGGFVAAGIYRPADDNNSAWLVKFSPLGEIEWQHAYDGSPNPANSEVGKAVVALNDGGYVLAGNAYVYAYGTHSFVIRVDPQGGILWQRSFDVSGGETVRALAEAPDGTLAMAGDTSSFEDGFPGWWIAAFQPDGSLSWSKTIHRSYYDTLHRLAAMDDGGWVLSGDTATSRTGPWATTSVRLDSSGATVSDFLFDHASEYYSRASELTDNGGPVVSVYADRGSVLGVLSFTENGELGRQEWFDACCEAQTMILEPDGGYLVGGDFYGGGERYGWLMRTGPEGEVVWARRYDSVTGIDDLIETAPGGIVAAGHFAEVQTLFWLDPVGDVPECPEIVPLEVSQVDPGGFVRVADASHRIRSITMYSEEADFLSEASEVTLSSICETGS
jgi:hypothetical protein